jgi:thymidylate synthase ThyX
MRANPLVEARQYAGLILTELRKVVPAFLTRVDLPERGERWSAYLSETAQSTAEVASKFLDGVVPEDRPVVTLTDFDPEGEVKVAAAALFAASDLPDDQLLEVARKMTVDERAAVLEAYVGDRANRRHKPGRAFERTSYRFDVLCDYGAFRDLQRHRPLTLEWQPLSTAHGFTVAPEIEAAGAINDWTEAMTSGARLFDAMRKSGLGDAAQYAVPMAYRIRFVMQMNAREAMHLIELRSTPQGHPVYRRVAQRMHDLIDEVAGHHAIAHAMSFVDHSAVDLERLEAERRNEAKRRPAPS